MQLHVHVGASAQPPFRVPRAVPRAARERLRERERAVSVVAVLRRHGYDAPANAGVDAVLDAYTGAANG